MTSWIDFLRGKIIGGPSVKASTVPSSAGPLYNVRRLLGSSSTLSLTSNTNTNLSLSGTTIDATSAISSGSTQIAVVRESIGQLAVEYPVSLSVAGASTLPSLESFGAVGDFRSGKNTASVSLSSPYKPTFSSGGVTTADIGKVFMLAGAGSGTGSTYDLVTTIISDGSGGWQLATAASTAVTNANWHCGTSDSAAIDAGFAAGGFYVPDNGKKYLDQTPGHLYNSNFQLQFMGSGSIVIGNYPIGTSFAGRAHWCHATGYNSNFSITPTLVTNVSFIGSGSGPHITVSPAFSSSNQSYSIKMLPITYVDGFNIDGVVLYDDTPGVSLFAISLESSLNGTVTNVNATNIYGTPNGQDTIHFLGNCNNVQVNNCTLISNDDASSQTQENGPYATGCTIQNITYNGCTCINIGHSAIKVLTGSLPSTQVAATINNITYNNCNFYTYMNGGTNASISGNGNLFYIANISSSIGGIVENITINGGSSNFVWPSPTGAYFPGYVPVPSTPSAPPGYGGLCVFVQYVNGITIQNHTFSDPTRAPFVFQNCNNITFANNTRTIQPGITVTPSSTALFTLTTCTNYNIQPDTGAITRSYNGQPYMIVT